MAEEEAKSRGGFTHGINLWAQTLAILAAGAFGFYQFIYQEQVKASAPVNLSMGVGVREAGSRQVADDPARRLIAIELTITATNPSTRTVYVLSNYWTATGLKIGDRPNSVSWIDLANNAVRDRAANAAGEYYAYSARQLVASGNVVTDTELKPSESVTRSFVFYVPEGAYDLINVETKLPSASRNDFDIDWRIAADGKVTPTVFYHGPRAPQDHPIEMHQDANGNYMDPADGRSLNPVQQAVARRQLSLWTGPERASTTP